MTSKDFVTSYFEAWNQHDAGGVAEHLSISGKYHDIPVQQEWNRDEFIEHLNRFFAADKNRYSLVGEILTASNSIAFQYRASPIGSDDDALGWMGAEFITMEGDTAGKIEDYYQDAEAMQAGQGIITRRYAKSGLDESGLKRVMDRVTQLMQQEQRYLDSNLSLPQLATELSCSVNHLSQAINAGFGMSFFDYVNQYRVNAAKKLLSAQDERKGAILDIALSVGFNSTSTFYAAFKKSTGQTPAQYRRTHKAQ
ncbi:MAG: helix-turn-helix domain-containing protein [Halioglobus sp.]